MWRSRFLKSFLIPRVRWPRGYATNRPVFPKAAALTPLPQPPLKSAARVQLLRQSNLAPPQPRTPLLTPPLAIQHLRQESPDEVLLYVDASHCHLTGTSSAGIYSCGVESVSISLRLPAGLTSVGAEAEALKRGISFGLPIAKRTGRGVVTVCGDCIPALWVVRRLLCEGRLAGVGPEVEVRVEWVKGHSGVKGNMEADKLAKKS